MFLRRSNGAAAHDITKHFCMPTEKALGSKTGLKKEIYHSLTLGAMGKLGSKTGVKEEIYHSLTLGAMGITTHTAALTCYITLCCWPK